MNEYRKAIKQLTTSELITEAARANKQLNQRFYRLEKKNLGLNESAYKYAQTETGKDKPRYTQSKTELSKLSRFDLINQLEKVNKKIESKTSTLRGLRKVEDNRVLGSIKALEERIPGFKVDPYKYKLFLQQHGGRLLNNNRLSSEQVMEDYMLYENAGASTEDFVSEFEKFDDSIEFDYATVKRNFKTRLK